MRSMILIGLAAALLAGCSTQTKILNGNSSSVTIQRDGRYDETVQMAAQHCAQYGKDIRLVHTEGFIVTFDCISG